MQWQFCVATVLLTGCQAIQAFDDARTPNETDFVNMWNRYTLCRSRTDVDQMWQDAQHLNRAVHRMDQAARAARLFPDPIEQTLAEPPPRLAVDPKAMAAACTLLVGQLAQDTGHSQFAAQLFRVVLSDFTQARYAYYRQEARMGLDRIAGNRSERVVMIVDELPGKSP